MTEKTVQCRICGKPYKFYMFHAGDQSACPECREKAEENSGGTYAPSSIGDLDQGGRK